MTKDEKCAALLNGLDKLATEYKAEGNAQVAGQVDALARHLGTLRSDTAERLYDILKD